MRNWKRDFKTKSKNKNHKRDVYKFLFRYFDMGLISNYDKIEANELFNKLGNYPLTTSKSQGLI